MMNVGTGFSTFWAPVINLAREPRWGRNIETPGEDPYLTGEYAEWFTKGMQESPDAPGYIQASACCKHYVANSMEQTTQKDGEYHERQHVDSLVTQQDLVDSYMRPFQSCVEKGKVSGLMCRLVLSHVFFESKVTDALTSATILSMVFPRAQTNGCSRT